MKKRRPLTADRLPLTARSRTLWPVVVAVAAFVLSRVGYYITGVRFDASSLPWFWQYVDPVLLKANLGQSLWYLHSQPPAFNLFLGIIVNLFPGHETAAFTVCYLLLGLAFALAMFLLLKELGVPATANAVLTSLYIASPACVLYENWLFYTYPLTVLLAFAALFWQRFLRRGRFLDALLLFTCATVLCMTWSLFHLVWLLVLVLALVVVARKKGPSPVRKQGTVPLAQKQGTVPLMTKWGQSHGAPEPALSEPLRDSSTRRERLARNDRGEPNGSDSARYSPHLGGTVPGFAGQSPFSAFHVRTVLAAAAAPLLIVVFWYGKNLAQTGEFTGSTWFGINFSKMTNSMLTVPERRALYDNGTISAVSMVPPFSNPDKYVGKAGTVPGRQERPQSGTVPVFSTGIEVLDQEMKPSGIPNFNNSMFIGVSRQYGRDALRILTARPTAYLHGLAESYLIYFLPASAYLFLDGNAGHISALDRFASIAFNGRFNYHSDHSLRQTQPARYYLQGFLNTGWFLILAYAFVLILGLILLFSRSRSSFIVHRSSLLFLWFSVAWMTFVANALEVGENNRFRFVTDPLVFVFIAALVVDWLARRKTAKV